MNDEGIIRTYSKHRYNLNYRAENAHSQLFGKDNILRQNTIKNISKFDKEDARLLTNFLRQWKNNANNSTISFVFESNTILPKNKINFLLGGNVSSTGKKTSGGIAFEKMFQKILQSKVVQKSSQGSATGSTYVKIGQINNYNDLTKEALKEEAINIAKDIFEETIDNKTFNLEIDKEGTVWLKSAVARFGKIDVSKSKNSHTYGFDVEGEPSESLKRIYNILNNGTFSLKSYITKNSNIHLGNTAIEKAATGTLSFLGDYFDPLIFFLNKHKYNNIKNATGFPPEDSAISLKNLAIHYYHLAQVYELVGFGLRDSAFTEYGNVDFLVVNSAFQGGDIRVYSTKDLLQNIKIDEHSNKLIFAIDSTGLMPDKF